MRKIRYFRCSGNHITEHLVEDDALIVECEKCNEEATRMISAPRCFNNTTGKSPSSNYTKQH